MARLVDRIWELAWVPPQALCYKPEARPAGRHNHGVSEMYNAMIAQRDAISSAPVYAADEVAGYFFRTAMRDADLKVQDFPAVAIPEDQAFIEFQKPSLRDTAGGATMTANLPQRWGWHVSRHTPAAFQRVFHTQNGLHPDTHTGLLCVLWFSPEDKSLIAPLAAVGLQVASDSELLGPPAIGLAFDANPDLVHDQQALFSYINVLLLPAVMAMAFMACQSTTILPVAREESLNKARVKRGKRPLAAHHVIDFSAIRDVLRYQGQAGVQGLAAAMRQCRSQFVQNMRGQSSLIALPGGDP